MLIQAPELANARFTRFRVRQGQDASCLNLFRPTNPTIIAPEPDFIEANRFTFAASLAENDAERANPWTLLNRRSDDGTVPVIADATSLQYVLHASSMAPKLVRSVKKCEARSVRLPTGSGAKRKQTRAFETDGAPERVYLEIQKLSPHDDVQRSLQARAVQISNDLAQVRFLLFAESEHLIPAPFLAVLAFWLVIIFASFSLFSPLNLTAFTCLSLFALSAACGIFLILELSRPFTGLLRLSSAPLRNALGTI